MRSVNANLLEINQAKSRINQAKKEGKTPDPKDLELVKTEKQNAFAISQYTDIMTIEKFAKHITSHGSVYSRADISAILYIAVDCMREMLLEGKKIRLGDLGDFSLLLTSKGAEDADKFTAQNITGVKVQWEPGQEFKNLRDDAAREYLALPDGPGWFTQDSSCPALLRIPLRFVQLRIPDYHRLWFHFPKNSSH